ncbi:MAG: DNA internalization-related competence protein ComEC/Rec2 [Pseudohongiellaceae bacterium]
MLRIRMLAVSIGIGSAALIPLGADQTGHWVVLPGLAVWLLCRRASHRPQLHAVLSVLVCVLLGAGYALWRGHLYNERLLPEAWDGEDIWVRGVVSGLPRHYEQYRQLDFRVQSSCVALLPDQCVHRSDGFEPRLVRLSVYDHSLSLLPGEEWWLRVRLRRPRGAVNPGLTDPEAHWFREGVAARGYVRETAFNDRIGTHLFSIDRWRHALLERITLPAHYDGQQGLVNALVLGDRGGISDQQWQLFADTGTSHLVVISGLHVGFVAWTVHALLYRIVRRIPRLPAMQPGALWAGVGAVCAAIVYAALAGFSLPTRRALIMLLVLLAGRLSGRRFPGSLGFCVALLLVLLMDPLAVVSAGFWYSFTAVGALLLAFAGRGQQTRRPTGALDNAWTRWGRAQWVVFIGLLVPMMVWHGEVSPISPLANVLAIPFVSLLVVPLCLGAALLVTIWPGGAPLLLSPAARCLEWLEQGLVLLRNSAGDLALLPLPLLHTAAIACVLVAAALLLMPRGWPLRHMAAPLMLPLLLPQQDALAPDTARILVADVGQGLGVIIRTRHHTVVYDSGPGPALMGRVLERQLREAAHQRVHTMILSHAHADHSGGLAGFDGRVKIDRWLTGSLQEMSGFRACEADREWRLDGVVFRFLHPPASHPADSPGGKENNRSCVLRVQAGEDALLLPGDIEAPAETRLVTGLADELQSDILLMPHHGSRSSSTAPFIEAVKPSLAVHSASTGNRFGHPHTEVLARYRQRGVRTVGTGESGAIGLCLGAACPAGLLTQRFRAWRPRYWRQL